MSQNEFYEQALARMQNFLANLPPSRLADESRTTPEREDDAIVAEVTYLSDQLAEVDQRSSQLARQQEAWDQRLGGLQSVVQRFRQAEFDSRRSMFPADLDADGLDRRSTSTAGWAPGTCGSYCSVISSSLPSGTNNNAAAVGRRASGRRRLAGAVARAHRGRRRRDAARRLPRRRTPRPTRSSHRRSTGRPPFPNRGFTNGRGF